MDGIALDDCDFRVLIENTAGAEFSLGGSFEQVAELIEKLRPLVPVGACLDTCHCHVTGYDLVTEPGYEETIERIRDSIGLATVRVWHMNDAKAVRGSRLDRHQHIGQGTMGLEPFRRLLNDKRFTHCAFIAETPVDEPEDDRRNVETMLALVQKTTPAKLRRARSPAK
jgi:deoxyribonuclease-4